MRRFQFSLKLLLAIPVFAGFTVAAFKAETEWIAALAIRILVLVAFAMAVAMLTIGDRYVRAFAAGAMFPLAAGAVWAVMPVFNRQTLNGPLPISTWADFILRDVGISDLKFRAAFLLSAALLGGIAGVVIGAVIQTKGSSGE